MITGFGELAAFGTALSWGVSTQVQGAMARKVGSTAITLLRMPYQVFFLGLMCVLMRVEVSTPLDGFVLLFLSGFLGVFLSDFLLYRAINIIGPPMAVLLLSTSTIFSALWGWIFLGEVIPLKALLGIGTTMAGILIVVTEQSGSTLLPGQEIPRGRRLVEGLLMATGAAVALASGFTLTKMGLQTGITPLWGAFLRLFCGALMLWLTGAARGWLTPIRQGLVNYPNIYWMLFLSCAVGSFGIWMSNLALVLAPVGIVATLIGLQPIVATILGAIWYRRRLAWQVVAGIAIAFGGTSLICLS